MCGVTPCCNDSSNYGGVGKVSRLAANNIGLFSVSDESLRTDHMIACQAR